ncbi:MAG TPA: sulfatase [Opitutaceae bacterium]|nr:sulfatase [Opitutaceae bacterium]
MKRFVCALLLLGASVLSATPMRGADDRPNILFVLLDDLRWDALGATGHPAIKTPAIDRIAKEGMTFRNAFVTTPVCFPSRASFLTGQYTHRHGIKVGKDCGPQSHALITFPLLLQRAGYRSGFFGKWHLGGDTGAPPPGFDRWVGLKEQGEYINPLLNIDGRMERVEGYLTDLLSDQVIDFIRQPATKPFLAYLSHKAPHAPFTPAERHKALFADMPIVRASSSTDAWEGKPVLRRPGVKLNPRDPDVTTTDENIRDQLRCIMAVEEGMQRILQTLESTGQIDRTVIVFTSDNGYFWGEHGLGGKHGPYEEALRVPLLVRYPPLIKAGARTDALALNIDIAPTLLALAGVPAEPGMQGLSLMPILRGEARAVRTSFLAEFYLGTGTARFLTWRAVRDERWKYVRYTGHPEMDELYDLQADPAEMKNLVDDPAGNPRVPGLQREMARLLADGAPASQALR